MNKIVNLEILGTPINWVVILVAIILFWLAGFTIARTSSPAFSFFSKEG